MPAPSTSADFLAVVRKSGVVEPGRLDACLRRLGPLPAAPRELAARLVRAGLLTCLQARHLLQGRWRGFTLGKYRLLERLGTGGMSNVFLCEHLYMGRRVAVKVLPVDRAEDPLALARFYREARAAAALDHPNVCRAHDIDHEGSVHFLVMEYVDGRSLHEVVAQHGPLAVDRAAHYVRQAARGLQHLHRAGLVHRDVKPGNLLLDRRGVVKVLDLGLARFFHDRRDRLTRLHEAGTVLGTVDYLAPEQALDSHAADARADVYGLGATFYYLLTGRPPFEGDDRTRKLLALQTQEPTPVGELRPEVPAGLRAVVAKMMAKEPAQRYPTPAAVVEALAEWTRRPVPPPPAREMPRLSPAARRAGPRGATPLPTVVPRLLLGRPPRPEPTAATVEIPRGAAVAVAEPAGPGPDPAVQPATVDLGQGGSPAPAGAQDTHLDLSKLETYLDLGSDAPPSGLPSDVYLVAAAERRRPRRLLVAAGVGVAVVGSLAYWLLSSPPRAAVVAPAPPAETPKQVAPPAPPARLVVTRAGAEGTFRTVRDALDRAKPGDHVVVQDDVHLERLAVEGAVPADVVVESSAAWGQPVLWRAPADGGDGQPLVRLAGTAGLRLKGFLFDGQDRAHDLVTVAGRCPGLTLEAVQLQGFVHNAVRLSDCSGDDDNPMSLLRVRVLAGGAGGAGVRFEAPPGRACAHIDVRDCRFEGPCRAALEVAGAVADVQVRRNRFFQAADGLLYKKGEPPPRLRLNLAGNTFCDLQRALHFETAPPADSQLIVRANLFARTLQLAQVDDFAPEPADVKAQWVWFDEPDPLRAAPAEARAFRKAFDVAGAPVTRARLDLVCDDAFTAWLNGERVGQGEFSPAARRVATFDVTRLLRPGRNVLAVLGTNKLKADGKWGPAGLLAQLTYYPRDGAPVTVATDQTWRAAKHWPDNWNQADYDAHAWPAARVLAPYGKGPWGWSNLVWEGRVQEHFPGVARPVVTMSKGNVRDKNTAEGFPVLDAAYKDFTLPTDPVNDVQFLRYPKDNPLSQAGPGKTPVGVPPQE